MTEHFYDASSNEIASKVKVLAPSFGLSYFFNLKYPFEIKNLCAEFLLTPNKSGSYGLIIN